MNTESGHLSLGRRLTRDSVWVSMGLVVSSVTSLLVSAFLARMLGPAEFGLYFLAFTSITVIAIVAQFGLNVSAVYLIADARTKSTLGLAGRIARICVTGGTVGAVLFALLFGSVFGAWFYGDLLRGDALVPRVSIIGLWLAAFALKALLADVLRGFSAIRSYVCVSGALTGVLTSVAFGLAWWRAGSMSLSGVISVSALAWWFALCVAGFLVFLQVRGLSKGPTNTHVLDVARVSIPLMLTQLLLVGQNYVAIWILAAFCPPTDVGILGAVIRLVEAGAFPLIVVNTIGAPMIAELHAAGAFRQLEKLLRAFAAIGTGPLLLMVIVVILVGDSCLGAIFGESYEKGHVAFVLLALSRLTTGVRGAAHTTLMMTGHGKKILWIAVSSIVLQVGAGVVVAPRWGLDGIALAIMGATFWQSFLTWYAVKRYVGVYSHPAMPRDLARLVRRVSRGEGV